MDSLLGYLPGFYSEPRSSPFPFMPPFNPKDPELWFALMESHFYIRGFFSQATRYKIAWQALPRQIFAPLRTAPSGPQPYSDLKSAVLQCFGIPAVRLPPVATQPSASTPKAQRPPPMPTLEPPADFRGCNNTGVTTDTSSGEPSSSLLASTLITSRMDVDDRSIQVTQKMPTTQHLTETPVSASLAPSCITESTMTFGQRHESDPITVQPLSAHQPCPQV